MTNKKISKSNYMKGLRCNKLLWWSIREPDAEELQPDLVAQHRFDMGNQVGQLARQQYPNGMLVEDKKNYSAWIKATQEALSTEDVIFEAAFSNDEAFSAIDILRRKDAQSPSEGKTNLWDLIEVKSTLDVKEEHLEDVSMQRWLLGNLGIPIDRTIIMILNRDCRYPYLENLFVEIDVTNEISNRLNEIEPKIEKIKSSLEGNLPTVEIGKHCDYRFASKDKSPCPFRNRCWPELPKHHISTLQGYGIVKSIDAEKRYGIKEITEIDFQFPLNDLQIRQVNAVKTGTPYVSKNLAKVLQNIEYPIAYLDFESISPAIPFIDGMRPRPSHYPAQFSCHLEAKDGSLVHYEWIATDSNNPLIGMVSELLKVCEQASTIVAHHAGFEKSCIESIAKAAPEYNDQLQSIIGKFKDLEVILKNNYYHPDFLGSYSLKAVLPVLVPEQSYSKLSIRKGEVASIIIEKLMNDEEGLSGNDREEIIQNLKEYCKLDTLAMVEIMKKLRSISQ